MVKQIKKDALGFGIHVNLDVFAYLRRKMAFNFDAVQQGQLHQNFIYHFANNTD